MNPTEPRDSGGIKIPAGITAAQIQPDPPYWPGCDACEVAYALKRRLSFGKGAYVWVWVPDCKHDKRRAQPGTALFGPDGRVDA